MWTVHVAALAGFCGHGNELPTHDNAGNVLTNAETRTFKDLNVKWLSYLINHYIMNMCGRSQVHALDALSRANLDRKVCPLLCRTPKSVAGSVPRLLVRYPAC